MLDKDELIYTRILNHNATAKEIIDYIDNLHKEISKLKTDKICNKVEEEVLQEYRNKINSLERLLEGQLYRNYIYYKDLAKQYQGSCIPKQKIKDIMEKWNRRLKWANDDDYYWAMKILQELQELLEENKQ